MSDNPDHVKKMTEASLRRQRKGLKTKIESKVEKKLIKLKIQNKYSKILHRKYQYDFIIGDDILLEVHGDYWHANPNIYGNGKKKINETQKFKIKQDKKKKEFAIKYGYRIYYIWESEINNNDFKVIYDIINELQRRKK
jgi:G:T-mismatch repair DNA endonuclease (very short patch repair protein)